MISLHHTNGSTTVTVNQQQSGGQWNLLGTYTLDNNSTLTLSSEANGYVVADGVKLVTTTTGTSSGVYYVHNDHLGTPQTLTDNNQDIVWAAEYDPFGRATVTTETVTNNVRFPGQYFDQETGLHYNYFRTYDPSTGRYITSDPTGLDGGVNTYGYTAGNPLNLIDTTGLLFGLPAGESFGDSAAQYWANKQVATGNPFYAIPGGLAALWTPGTSNDTVTTLFGGYGARLFGPFSPRGTPKYLQRLRKYFRVDPPHHNKGWETDGTIPKWFRDKFKDHFTPLPPLPPPEWANNKVDDRLQKEFCRQNPSARNCDLQCQ